MADYSFFRLQLIVFALVSAAFTNIYITQPVLPVLQHEFSADMVLVSFSVSAVILGIAISILPFGFLADRLPIHPIILTGGFLVAIGGLVCAVTKEFWVLIGARFLQGIFTPALTTCIMAYLAKALPAARLNVVMGYYVAAGVLGGMGGRLIGGWIHFSLHWRYAFVLASILILITTLTAVRAIPRTADDARQRQDSSSFFALLKRWELLRIYLAAMGSFSIFSSVFNYLPFRLTAPPFNLSTETMTLLYLVYVVGIFMGTTTGRISNRFGSGATLIGGCAVLGLSLIHAAAVGSLNRKLKSGQGRANALYVLFYYMGGWLGITCTGFAYEQGGWSAMIYICAVLLIFPLSAGVGERKSRRRRTSAFTGRS
jgi:YNFM family putative membrane transporter